MKATAYLFKRTIINGIKNLTHHVGALIGYIIFAVFIIAMVIMSNKGIEVGEVRNLNGYNAIITGVYLLIFFMTLATGLKNGTAIFSMSDVNLLFTAPIDSRRILVYAMLRQAGTLVLASLFLFAQYGNIRSNCGLGGEAMAGLIIGYILAGISAQLLSTNLYALCATKPRWRKRIDWAIRGAGVLICSGIVYFVMNGEDILASVVKFFGGEWWDYVPFIGWTRGITTYIAASDWTTAFILMGVTAAGLGLLILWLVKGDADYYEDVLSAAENVYNMKAAAADGNAANNVTASKRAKREVKPLGGKGAWVFFHRAMREQSRRTSWLFSLSTIAAVVAPCFGMIIQSDLEISDIGMWPVLYFGAYMMVFLSMSSNVGRELTKHYLFVAPQSSFSKLAAICAPQLVKHAADTAVFVVVSLIALKPDAITLICAAVAYFSVGAVFASGMLLIEKLLGSLKSKGLIVLLYFIILIVLVAPGFVGGTILNGFIGNAAYIVTAVWNFLMSAVIILLCKNLLSEMAH